VDSNQEVLDGQEAQRILESDVYKNAMQKLADGYQSQWMNSKPEDVQERERAYIKLQLLADFVNEVRTVMETGQFAEHEIKKQEITTHY
tara:strand:+ start:5 stop:271 length:267 start_codon:yes stop_codon:yes gene_type:complete